MNTKIIKFTELCARSRHEGLSKEKHQEKKSLAEELVKDGLMTNDGCYNFVNESDSTYFSTTITNWNGMEWNGITNWQ